MMLSDRRAVNDDRRRAFGSESGRRVAFVCECADAGCRRAVLLTVAEYDESRAAGRAVVVDPSHEPPASPR
ncbi:MAG: hypothetical protein ACRDM1_12665 [Gaiellaceae bacterium]